MEKCLAEIRISFLLLTSVRKVLNSARVEPNPGRIGHLPHPANIACPHPRHFEMRKLGSTSLTS